MRQPLEWVVSLFFVTSNELINAYLCKIIVLGELTNSRNVIGPVLP